MKKLVPVIILFLFVFSTVADAQRWRTRRYEAFFGAGTANVYGDIGGSLTQENWFGLKDIEIESTRPSIAFGAKYKINHRFNARLNFAGAMLHGSDEGSSNFEQRPVPGISWLLTEERTSYKFTSMIFEPSAMGEFFIIPENRSMVSDAIYNKKGMVNGFRSINLYVFGGGGAVLITPPAVFDFEGNKVEDDGFQVEGREYKPVGIVIPIGVGAKMDLFSYWTISAEFGRRYTFTDYIDGYTSKFSKASDTYDLLNITLSYKIRTAKNGLPILFRKMGLN